MLKYILVSVLLAILLAGCGVLNTPPVETLNITQPVIKTATPSPSPTETATATATLTPTVTESPTPIFTPTPIKYGPANFPVNVNPLTGLIVEDPELLNRRPVAVKINIVPRRSNRPPWGLSFADIVYDYYHNDGYSRFFAIFYGKDADLVGPIRSGRMLDYELVHMYQSNFVYGSADALINQRLMNSDFSDRLVLEHFASSCPPTDRTPLCRYEPSTNDFLLGDSAAISGYLNAEGVSNGRQNLEGMSFNSEGQSGGVEGTQIYIRYSSDNYTRWDYDPDSGTYLHFQDNVWDQGQGEEYAPLIDRLTDEQITADNVVVILARHEYFQQPPSEIIDIFLSGTGTAYAYRDGQMYDVVWNRPTIYSVLSLTYTDGTPFPFKPGNTWFQVVGAYTEAVEETDGVWRFNFQMP